VIAVTGFEQSHLADIATVSLVAKTFDFSTRSQAAINCAGIFLLLRGLIIGMTSGTAGERDASDRAGFASKEAMGHYTYRGPALRPRPDGGR